MKSSILSSRDTLGGDLSLVLAENVVPYPSSQRDDWKAGRLLDSLLPECERPRRKKYAIQRKNGFHFGEVLAMNALLPANWRWHYEDYRLFRRRNEPTTYEAWHRWLHRPRKAAPVYATGTAQLCEIIGSEAAQHIWEAGEAYASGAAWPTEPDLFAYRLSSQGSYEYVMVEAKSVASDSLKTGQLLGLAILRAVLGCDVVLQRYCRAGSRPTARTYGEGRSFSIRS